MTALTLRRLEELANGDGVDALRITLAMWKFEKPTYERWISLVETAISHEVAEIANKRNDLQECSEDAITAILVLALNALGLEANHARVNGNCDVVISYNEDYMWLGEAKIFKGVSVIWDGYLQLTSRYSTGLPDQNHGGMLLYCIKANATELLAEWRGTLIAQVNEANARDGTLPLTFRSSDVCRATGLPLEILHFAFPLFYAPLDGTLKLTKEALEAGRLARTEARRRDV